MMEFRHAAKEDLASIVRLLADDTLGASRERYEEPLPQAYAQAFSAIQNQQGNFILLAVEDAEVVGCLQLTLIPGLARLGMTRAQIEGVRISNAHRGKGIGEALFRHAIAYAREQGCGLVQLTTDKSRGDAHRFYQRLGFADSHVGMKLMLVDD
ncbi:L-amino acid N-acyltransferase YncA [Collimonas sp. PA-H2]|uniref:GNAT family N-acetyltransferase n=1 Tax=Collimonas sp. PA-H2 TaxID=1881062 RepID=UPI000C01475C|nr:GNAT family N-acetyltransferase [Collimonas sp. PA-H2]PFH12327.1 L-amino acid N-acyltransferase YncA [Collimonas sp. PA-H2]